MFGTPRPPGPRIKKDPRKDAVNSIILFGLTIGFIKCTPFLLGKIFRHSVDPLSL